MSRCTRAPLGVVLLAAAVPPTFGQPPSTARNDAAGEKKTARDRAPTRCISLLDLQRTEILDDRTILFHMRGGTVYLNHLGRECPGLEREKRFMYSPTSTQLCAIDGVTVIEKWDFGFTRGFTCALGRFDPITPDEYEAAVQAASKQDEAAQTSAADARPQGDARPQSNARTEVGAPAPPKSR